jgi:hypothetical protein
MQAPVPHCMHQPAIPFAHPDAPTRAIAVEAVVRHSSCTQPSRTTHSCCYARLLLSLTVCTSPQPHAPTPALTNTRYKVVLPAARPSIHGQLLLPKCQPLLELVPGKLSPSACCLPAILVPGLPLNSTLLVSLDCAVVAAASPVIGAV